MRPDTAERNHQHRSDRRPGSAPTSPHPTTATPSFPSENRMEWVPRVSASSAPLLSTPPSETWSPYNRHRRRQPQFPRPSSPLPGGGSDASVPQLVQEIQDKLVKRAVECMICYDMVGRSAPVWSCSSCYSPSSSADGGATAGWRCPGCQSVQSIAAKDLSFICFCGSQRD